MELDELFPKTPVFTLTQTKKEYELRPPNLEDAAWAKSHLGSEQEIAKMFEGPDWPKCIKFVYRLMKDKSDFMAEVEQQISDDGDPIEIRVTGPEKLLRSIQGNEEGAKILGALTRALSIANPMVEKYINDQKKSLLSGKKSSTPSPRNMAGRSKK